MAIYPSTNILLVGKETEKIGKIQDYLEIVGTSIYQNQDVLYQRNDFIYFLGDSSIFLKKFKTNANIKIYAVDDEKLSELKGNIESILNN